MTGFFHLIYLLFFKLKSLGTAQSKTEVPPPTMTWRFNKNLSGGDHFRERKEMAESGLPMLVVPTDSIKTLHYFLNDNKQLMYRFLLGQLSSAIMNNWPQLELFRVGHTPYVARVEKKDYERTLSDAQKFFIDIQDFERAEQCQSLIIKHRVNLLIDSTRKNNN